MHFSINAGFNSSDLETSRRCFLLINDSLVCQFMFFKYGYVVLGDAPKVVFFFLRGVPSKKESQVCLDESHGSCIRFPIMEHQVMHVVLEFR